MFDQTAINRLKGKRKRNMLLVDNHNHHSYADEDNNNDADYEDDSSSDDELHETTAVGDDVMFQLNRPYCSNENSNSSSTCSSTGVGGGTDLLAMRNLAKPRRKSITSSRRRAHKILVTEEKMADAFRELQLEMNMSTSAQPTSNLYTMSRASSHQIMSRDVNMMNMAKVKSSIYDRKFELSSDDADSDDENQAAIVLSSELKESFKRIDEERFREIKNLLKSSSTNNDNNMQLIPYSVPILPPDTTVDFSCHCSSSQQQPNNTSYSNSSSSSSLSSTSSSSSSSTGQMMSDDQQLNSAINSSSPFVDPASMCPYRVEEPTDKQPPLARNKLKRNFSQLSKIPIEELGPSQLKSMQENEPIITNPSQFYLVDDYDNTINASSYSFYRRASSTHLASDVMRTSNKNSMIRELDQDGNDLVATSSSDLFFCSQTAAKNSQSDYEKMDF